MPEHPRRCPGTRRGSRRAGTADRPGSAHTPRLSSPARAAAPPARRVLATFFPDPSRDEVPVRFLHVQCNVAALALCSSAFAQTTWYVALGGSPPGTGTTNDPYTSIQYAIAQSSTLPGDTI